MTRLRIIMAIVISANTHSFAVRRISSQQNRRTSEEQSISREIAKFSRQAGLVSLQTLTLPYSSSEVRIWKGGGLLYPRCFILRFQGATARAFIVSPKVVNGRAVYSSPHNVIYERTNLLSPRSGWESITSHLKETGMDSSARLVLDNTYEPYPDEEILAIEVKSGRQYSFVFYLDSTKSQDGRKAFGLCKMIESEFGKKLGCGS